MADHWPQSPLGGGDFNRFVRRYHRRTVLDSSGGGDGPDGDFSQIFGSPKSCCQRLNFCRRRAGNIRAEDCF